MTEFREICYSSGNTITVAVNISAKDIARAGFAEKVLSVIDEVRFPPECLEIEITEYSFVEEGSHTIENIKILRDNQIMIVGKFAQLRADRIFLICRVARQRDMTAFLLQQRAEYRKVGIINLARRERKPW